MAREQSVALKALQRRLRRPLTKRERAAELRRIEARYRRDRDAARRRAEAARRAAIARQIAIEKAMREEAQTLISRDDVTGEDPEVRRIAVNALGNHAGTVVVMDPMSGRIYTAVNQEWAFRRGFKPCSTIKLVTGLAGLNEKVIETSDTTPVSDRYKIDLTDALAYSNNTFFQQVSNKIGFDKMVDYAKVMGLGQKTGVNVSNEYAGHLPVDRNNISLSRMGSHGDEFEVTPLQLATLVSAMSNGGKLLAPYIPKVSQGETKSNAKVRSQIPIEPEYLRRMVPGMVGAVNYGSGKKAYDPMQTVAGKTGTCISNGAWIGLFTSYAPLANPRLAVVVIARGSDGRRHFPAAVAGQIYRELGPRFGTNINVQLASGPADKSTDSKAAELNEEEKDADDAEAAELESAEKEAEAEEAKGTTATTTVSPATPIGTPRNSTVKPVLKPIERHNPEPPKSTTKSATTPPKKSTTVTQSDSRARRVNP
jgi:membrane peptidoglycan carboxypeptidase